MLDPAAIRSAFFDDALFLDGKPGDHDGNPAALPDASLEFLTNFVRRLGARTAVEFGSGRSTRALLDAGLQLTTVEDSEHWMRDTLGRLGERQGHQYVVHPLRRIWDQRAPFLAWAERVVDLSTVDFVLIDSPYFPPFREAVLLHCLRELGCGVIVLDDARIPTVQRFCDRIAARNSGLLHRRSRVGHGFDIFGKLGAGPIRDRRPLIETAKAWRRYLMGAKVQASIAPAER